MSIIRRILHFSTLAYLGCSFTITSCSFSVDVLATCKMQADPSYESILEMVKQEFSSEWEQQYESIAKSIFDTPDRRRMDFASCLMDEGALCYVQTDGLPDIKPLLIERGWENPTPWDCYWQKSDIVTNNPFS